jgi:hypothetical protein
LTLVPLFNSKICSDLSLGSVLNAILFSKIIAGLYLSEIDFELNDIARTTEKRIKKLIEIEKYFLFVLGFLLNKYRIKNTTEISSMKKAT